MDISYQLRLTHNSAYTVSITFIASVNCVERCNTLAVHGPQSFHVGFLRVIKRNGEEKKTDDGAHGFQLEPSYRKEMHHDTKLHLSSKIEKKIHLFNSELQYSMRRLTSWDR